MRQFTRPIDKRARPGVVIHLRQPSPGGTQVRVRFWALTAFQVVLFLLALVLNTALGAVPIPPDTLLRLLAQRWLGLPGEASAPSYMATILFDLRLPHTALMALTGMALSISGAAYQGLFRNPLAGPYLIGVASGAGLGAVVALSLFWPTQLLGMYTVPAAAFVGALLTVVAVYALARVNGHLPAETLILAGVALSALTSAVTSFLMLRSQGEVRRALAYLLGGAPMAGWEPVLAMLPYALVGIGGLLLAGHALNVLQFGEEQAHQLGLPVERAKRWILLAASLATAAAVAFAGIIGFLGLMVPHLVRRLLGEDYRRLLPLSALNGATALLLFDLVARIALRPQSLPIGIVTALVGAPFFLWILRQTKHQTLGLGGEG